jgi:hypothetical protein
MFRSRSSSAARPLGSPISFIFDGRLNDQRFRSTCEGFGK